MGKSAFSAFILVLLSPKSSKEHKEKEINISCLSKHTKISTDFSTSHHGRRAIFLWPNVTPVERVSPRTLLDQHAHAVRAAISINNFGVCRLLSASLPKDTLHQETGAGASTNLTAL